MKTISHFFLAFLVLASCARMQDMDVITPEDAHDAIAFDIYTRGTVETKAGFTGDIDEASFKVAGFGVYAYVSTSPDYMRNQHVTYSGGNWVYSPVKYWPNTNTSTISFYAYAPYVASAPYTTTEAAVTNANNKDGILYIPGPNDTGDPKIVYHTAADPSNNVDLMFGVAAEAHTSPDVTAGLPFLSMTKLKLGEKMKFNFKHALTKLAVNVDGYFDEVNGGSPGNNEVDANTRIVIESVSISTDRLASMGTLNLHNTTANTPKWDLGDTPVTISDYSLPVASNLHYVDGNAASVVHFSQQPLGVTKTAQSLMGYGIDGTTAASLMFVPNGAGTGNLDVTIVYHVITRDSRLKIGYNDVRNSITKTITGLTGNAFKPGYLTTLNLHLGLASVKFDAEISNWESGETENVDLPVNEAKVYTYSAGPSTKIQIAPCNLMYKHSNNSWSLTEKPWTLVETGSTVANNYGDGGASPEDISLFGWGTSGYSNCDPWLTSGTNSDYGPATGNLDDNHNWGANDIAGLSGAGWRVPTHDEWVYLLSSVSGNTARYNQYGLGRIEIANETYVNGLFILPDADSWTDPFPSRPFTLGYRTDHTTYNQYSASDWGALSLAGMVFLPVAGMRGGSTDITTIYGSNVSGNYWSSTRQDANNAYLLSISNAITPDSCTNLNRGASVRLIRDIN